MAAGSWQTAMREGTERKEKRCVRRGKEMGIKFERRGEGGGRWGVWRREEGEGIATSGSLKESGINRQLRSSRREEM